ncbi:hypothetical protein Nepgr_013553 [Nepenthes gracilis]|uniref:Uncharacterized protein n=1 Tax=Nepenthes gracilis TaxID=150966 RepID=A0AAD3XNS3_NEPGR|nr:hypothetical protein Nepgr_013553 [Nepenthes gracilis]
MLLYICILNNRTRVQQPSSSSPSPPSASIRWLHIQAEAVQHPHWQQASHSKPVAHTQGTADGNGAYDSQFGRHITAFHSSTQREVLPSQQSESVSIQYQLLKLASEDVSTSFIKVIAVLAPRAAALTIKSPYRAAQTTPADQIQHHISKGSRLPDKPLVEKQCVCSISQQHGINQGSSCIRSQQLQQQAESRPIVPTAPPP